MTDKMCVFYVFHMFCMFHVFSPSRSMSGKRLTDIPLRSFCICRMIPPVNNGHTVLRHAMLPSSGVCPARLPQYPAGSQIPGVYPPVCRGNKITFTILSYKESHFNQIPAAGSVMMFLPAPLCTAFYKPQWHISEYAPRHHQPDLLHIW